MIKDFSRLSVQMILVNVERVPGCCALRIKCQIEDFMCMKIVNSAKDQGGRGVNTLAAQFR